MIVRSKTFRGWMKANFTRQDLKDMVTHGVSSGFSGLIYYTETAKLYDKFSNEIWDALYEDAQESGYDSILKFIAEFLNTDDVTDDWQFKNLLVWYMAERTAQELLEDMV